LRRLDLSRTAETVNCLVAALCDAAQEGQIYPLLSARSFVAIGSITDVFIGQKRGENGLR
jgi:hypothetical protein